MVSKKIFDLKKEVLEIASAKKHNWQDSDFDTYGEGDETHYGHVKLTSSINDTTTTNDSHAASVSAVKSYVQASQKILIDEDEQHLIDVDSEEHTDHALSKGVISRYVKEKINSLLNSLTTDKIKVVKNDTTTTLTSTLNAIDKKIDDNYNPNNIDLSRPREVSDKDIHDLIEPGYYQYKLDTRLKYFERDDVCCKDAIVIVEGQPDGTILQYIYPTEDELKKDTSNTVNTEPDTTEPNATETDATETDTTETDTTEPTTTETDTTEPTTTEPNATETDATETTEESVLLYKLNGKKFLRTYRNETWSNLSLVHTPQSSIDVRYNNEQDVRDKISIKLTETTAGFIFNWQHNNDDNDSYTIKKDFYEYETIGTFLDIPIGDNPYIFGNLIGKVDVKIDKNSMAVRSTLSKGSKVKNVNMTLFVPRMEE